MKRRLDPSSFTVVLLLASLALTAVLAWQAHAAVRSHRQTAEEVLRDYAGLAADEFIRRAANRVGYYGYAPLMQAMRAAASVDTGPAAGPPDTAASARELDERSRAAVELIRRGFVMPLDPTRGKARFSHGPAEVAGWLQTRLAALASEELEGPLGYRVVHGDPSVGERSFVVAQHPQRAGWVLGFEVERAALARWMAQVAASSPLLPASLAGDDPAGAEITLTVRDGLGELFRSGPGPASDLTVQRDFGPIYNGVLDGVQVAATVDPSQASRLVIGGLPRSRLPLLLALLGLTAGLLVAAVVQLRRERALTRLRAEFVSRVSHELRTPLTQIRMFAETLLLDRVRSDVERTRSLEIIDRESRRLTQLVENILQFSRSERGALRLDRRPCHVAPLIRELVESFRPLVAGSGVRLVTRVDEIVAPLDGDAVRQMVLNLLDNAVKYGPPEQEIRVEAQRRNGHVEIAVDDQGPGVPDRDRQRVWQRFQRLERDAQSATSGTGIGLAVVRELARLHGGEATVLAGSRGGARFVVALPLVAPSTETP